MFTLVFFFYWCLNVSHQMIFNYDCIDPSDKGAKYYGNVSTTERGYTCQRWDVNTPWENVEKNQHEPNNYCRNVNKQQSTWCYTTSLSWRFDWCYIPICDCRKSVNDMSYKGHINTTRNGYTCLKWKLADRYRTEEQNYCRTPIGDRDNEGGPWCYVANKTKRWDRCNVPVCTEITCSRQSIPSYPNSRVLNTGNRYSFNQQVKLSCNSGYNGTSVIKTCTNVNTWSGSPITCTEITCSRQSIPSYPNSQVVKIGNRYKFNQQVTLSCISGYNGTSVIKTCTKVNTWSGSSITCTRKAKCTKQSLKLTDHITYRPVYDIYTSDIHVKLTCERGFDGHPVTSHCINIDTWSAELPNCLPKPCPHLNETVHLKRIPNKTEYHYSEVVTFACEGDLHLSAQSPKLTCGIEGNSVKWIGEIPTCEVNALPHGNDNLAAPIGGAVGGIVLLVVIVVVVKLVKRRQTGRPKQNQSDTPGNNFDGKPLREISTTNINAEGKDDGKEAKYYNEGDTENGGNYSFSTGQQIPKSAILVKNFYDYVDKGRGENGLIEQEFHKLKSGLQKPTLAALKDGNKAKNKYRNIYPYDETRVVLNVSRSSESDYVNASFIHGPGGVRKYIASQGPLDNTVDDFWRMVWQYDCGKIVMLTNIFENGKHKCVQYWPDPYTSKITYGDIAIILSKEDVYSDFTVRTLKMQKDNKTKTVQQFHFTAWPDKDVPKYASSIVHFRYKVNNAKVTVHGPMVVHCSAGIGRTGTFIALDYVLNQSKELDYVDVFSCVEGLRNQRISLVQTQHQYMFLHEAILEAVMCPNTGITSIEFPNVYKDLMEFDNKEKKSKLLIKYETLNSISPRHGEDVFERGKAPENKGKNRYSNIIPVGSEMPMLSTDVDGHNEYINAVFLPGYRSNKMFIITQMPMESTRTDLWRLVYDYDIPTIVMLNQENCTENQYWPEKNTPVTFGPFEIQQTGGESMDLYNSLTLNLSYKQKETRKVHLFQSKFWDDEARVPSLRDDIITLMTKVEEGRDSRGRGPILVHCLNGCDKSGLYCVMATVIERLRIEQDVDIQHIIKLMRNRRPQIIPNFEQFQFVHEVVMGYMKQFETYSNFQ